MQAHVFVAMPFDAKEVKAGVIVDFDEVYSTLIAPALQKAGCVPFRADQEEGAGDIRTDMFFELVTADAIVADISILNANVYYELGVRHGVTPRGVFMIHGGWGKPPFDIASDRRFEYNGKLFLPDAKNPRGRIRIRAVDVRENRIGRLGNANEAILILKRASDALLVLLKFIERHYARAETQPNELLSGSACSCRLENRSRARERMSLGHIAPRRRSSVGSSPVAARRR